MKERIVISSDEEEEILERGLISDQEFEKKEELPSVKRRSNRQSRLHLKKTYKTQKAIESDSSSNEIKKKKSGNVIVDSDTSQDLATPYKKRKLQKSDSEDSDIVTPFSRTKQVTKRVKRVTRSMNTSPDVYSLPSDEEIEEIKVKKQRAEPEPEEDVFEDIISYSSDSSVFDYGKKLFCHLCNSDQPFDNFSSKQQQNYIDRYCLNHTWAGGQQNYIDRIQDRVRQTQAFYDRMDKKYGEGAVQESDLESDDFITTHNDLLPNDSDDESQ